MTAINPLTQRALLRTGATLIVASAVASLVVEQFHPAHEPPNNHPAVFAEYAASTGVAVARSRSI